MEDDSVEDNHQEKTFGVLAGNKLAMGFEDQDPGNIKKMTSKTDRKCGELSLAEKIDMFQNFKEKTVTNFDPYDKKHTGNVKVEFFDRKLVKVGIDRKENFEKNLKVATGCDNLKKNEQNKPGNLSSPRFVTTEQFLTGSSRSGNACAGNSERSVQEIVEYFDPEKFKKSGAKLKKEFKVKKSTPKKHPSTPRNLNRRSVISSYSNQKPTTSPLRQEKITKKPLNKSFAKLKPEKVQLFLKSEKNKEDIKGKLSEFATIDESRTDRAGGYM